MLVAILMENFKTRQKDAATEKLLRKYQNDSFTNKLTQRHERHVVYHEEYLNHTAAKWVRENAFVKG